MTFPESKYPLLKFAFTRHPVLFCIIHGLTIGGNAVLPFIDQWHWLVGVIGAGIEAIYWIGSWKHRERLRALELQEPYNPLNHYENTCEQCSPVKMADGHSPIVNIVWYWAAFKSIKREDAEIQVNDPVLGPRIKAHHEQYLAKPEFNR